eukprot:TRINITY_DN123829_c0_g1_i1.p1 TRINITY_DN123829_c0_g1~~TRINITY_DN123829_c0_g1_i1.p1  ORF type:complete len:464 (+),score=73.02 TRINITY_DN123829_c0_g1_i1:39-1430(+)
MLDSLPISCILRSDGLRPVPSSAFGFVRGAITVNQLPRFSRRAGKLLHTDRRAVRRRAASSETGTDAPWWQEAWFRFEENLFLFIAGLVWRLRVAGRAPAGRRYFANRKSLDSFNSMYSLRGYAMMATDEAKRRSFREAIRRGLREKYNGSGDPPSVLEIGCGAYALFCEICLEEGAQRVLAAEGNSMAAAHAASRLKGTAARVFPGLSQELTADAFEDGKLPKVVVMETVGDWAANEYMVGTYLDAKGRICDENAVWVPGQVQTSFAPVATPYWGDLEGPIPAGLWLLGSDETAGKRLLASPEVLEFYDFNNFTDSMLKQEREVDFKFHSAGHLQGFVIWVELAGAPGCEVLNSLEQLDLSWAPVFLSLPSTFDVAAGETLKCRTSVLPAAEDGPRLRIEVAGSTSTGLDDKESVFQFEWKVKDGAKWLLPDGRQLFCDDQQEDLLSMQQGLLWELLGPPRE